MTARPSGSPDAIVIGSGPNGLSAAIAIARAGRSVRVYEGASTIGGSTRSLALTEPGFIHDVCATVHALVPVSPFLQSLPLDAHGYELVHPPTPCAHPFDDGSAAVVERSLDATVESLSREDGRAYRSVLAPFVERSTDLMTALLGPPGLQSPWLMARFAALALRSARALANGRFRDERTKALVAGAAAHSVLPLDFAGTAGFGLALLVSAHAGGWPVARGGSQRLANALANHLRSLGGEILTDAPVQRLDDLPKSRAVLCDCTPRQLVRLSGARMPARYRRRLERFRYGPGVFKIDWALSEPVPWRASACRRAGTIHVGGTFDELAASERAAWEGRPHERPFVLVVQPTVCDATRAPAGRHVLWAYSHVPHGTSIDFTERIERQIERFAPGFRDCISSRHVLGPAGLEAHNPNLIGGDITGGAAHLAQIVARPVLSLDPYATPMRGVYLCSSSTPPGVGVHGMCGYHAAQSALRRDLR